MIEEIKGIKGELNCYGDWYQDLWVQYVVRENAMIVDLYIGNKSFRTLIRKNQIGYDYKGGDYINYNVSPDSEEYFDLARFVKDYSGQSEFDPYKYMNKYNKEHYKRVTILVPQSNTEMIEHLKKHKPVSSYVLQLIEQDMKKSK